MFSNVAFDIYCKNNINTVFTIRSQYKLDPLFNKDMNITTTFIPFEFEMIKFNMCYN